nr:hypothetical protein [Tanacetum cinerariifolium]
MRSRNEDGDLGVKESDKIERYVGGLPDLIHGGVMASKPKTMQDAVEFATELMDKKIHTFAKRQTENKRKFEDTSRNNQNQQQQNKRHNTGRAYTGGPGEKKPYGKYMLKGCHVFLAHVTTKKTEDKSEGKQLEDVPIVRDFPEVFIEDLLGLPPTRQVEFHIDLIPSDAPVTRAPYRLAPFEMKELSNQLQELSDKGFIRQNLMNRVCKPYLDKFVIVFIGDIRIYSKNKKEHEEHLKEILELLKKEELYAKIYKCEFWIPKLLELMLSKRSKKNTKCVNAISEELTVAKHKLMLLAYCC